ncbi:hypothetical protein ZOSMA_2G03220 [Zostera marina]|uniref:Uncharacterized protein n=1 Tax=Zostera marina TaxID=29655 RepID=A0A0K9PBH1_ZOSMR|nr:hypothetical protein ZOSMA_2G03220 [Zostera marina]
MEVTESISSPSKNGTISFVKVISVVDVNIPKIDADDIQIRSQSPASNRSIVSPLEVEFGTGKSEAGSSEFGNPYDQLNPKQSIGIVLGSSETIQLPFSDPKSHVDTNTCFSSEKIVLSKENQPLEEISVSDGKEYSSTTSTDASEFFDASDDVVGVIESTEGHGGSESEKTEATIANPVNVANQTEEHPNESNHSITGQLSCEILPVNSYGVKKHGDGDDEEEEAQEKNKTEEIKSRVVNWQNVKDVIVVESKKPHVALKNLLVGI